jgi:hypothetical protein
MNQLQTLSDIDVITHLVAEQVNTEQKKYAVEEYSQNDQNNFGYCQFTRDEIYDALDSNEDGDAKLYIDLKRNWLCYDTAADCWYKWHEHFWEEDILNDAMRAVDDVVAVYLLELASLSCEQQEEALNRTNDKDKIGKIEAIRKKILKRVASLQTVMSIF